MSRMRHEKWANRATLFKQKGGMNTPAGREYRARFKRTEKFDKTAGVPPLIR